MEKSSQFWVGENLEDFWGFAKVSNWESIDGYGKAHQIIDSSHQKYVNGNISYFVNRKFRPPGDSTDSYYLPFFYGVGSITSCRVKPNAICDQPPPPAAWPSETCAEINSSGGGFTPACEAADPNLPPALKGEYTAFELCDKNGNPVTVERFGQGWRYTTDKWEVTVSGSGTVQSVRPVH